MHDDPRPRFLGNRKLIAAALISVLFLGGLIVFLCLPRARPGLEPEARGPEPESSDAPAAGERRGPEAAAADPAGKKAAKEDDAPAGEPGPPLLRVRVSGEGGPIPGARVLLFSTKKVEEAIDHLQKLAPEGGEMPDFEKIAAGIREELESFKRTAIAGKTDPGGICEFRKVAPGGYFLLTLADGWLFRHGDVTSLARERTETVEVVLDRGASITGRVVGASGDGVPAAVVTAEFRPGGMAGVGTLVRKLLKYVNGEFLRGPFQSATREDGSFTLVSLPPGVYDLSAGKPPGVEAHLQGVETGTEEALIYLGRGAVVTGYFGDLGGIPLPGVRLKLERQDDMLQLPLPLAGFSDLANNLNRLVDGGPIHRESGARGEFRVGPLEPGKYRLSVEDRGYMPFVESLDLAWDQVLDLGLLRLDPGESISGVVRSEDGQPLEGAKVLATTTRINFLSTGGALNDLLSGRTTVPTGSDGTFRMTGLLKGRYRVTATYPRHVPEFKEAAPGGEPVELTLKRGLRISGLVKESPGGSPIPRARVEAGGARTETSAEGTFVLEGVVPENPSLNPFAGQERAKAKAKAITEGDAPRPLKVKANASGYLASEESLDLGAGETEVEIAMEKVSAIEGRVLDPDGNPAPGSLVRLSPVFPDMIPGLELNEKGVIFLAVAVSDLEGRFSFSDFRGARDEASYRVIADHVLHARGSSEPFQVPRAGEEVDEVEVRLLRSSRVKGTVSDGRGPIARAAVRLRKDRKERKDQQGGAMFMGLLGLPKGGDVTYTLKEGNYTFERTAPGDYLLSVEMAGFIETPSRAVAIGPGEDREEDFVLDPGGEVWGTVEDGGGAAVSGARVRLLFEKGGPESDERFLEAQRFLGGAYKSTRSLDDGTFRIGGLPKARYVLLVDLTGYIPFEAGGVSPGEKKRVVLLPSAAFRGLVSDGASGQPITQFQVSFKKLGAEGGGGGGAAAGPANPRDFFLGMGRDHASPEGRFSRDDLEAGRYEVKVAATGYVPVKVEVSLAPGVAQERRFLLSRAGRIRGVISDMETRRPVAGAKVGLARERRREKEAGEKKEPAGEARDPGADDAQAMGDFFAQEWAGETSTSEADGSFLLEGVPEGPQTVVVTHPAYITEAKEDLEAPFGTEVEVSFLLRSGLSVSGKVRDAAGKAVPGQFVFLRGAGEGNARVRKSATTDPQGDFQLGGLEKGDYRLLAPRRNGRPGAEPLEVRLEKDQSGIEVVVPAE